MQDSHAYEAVMHKAALSVRAAVALRVVEDAKKELYLAIGRETSLGEPIASLAKAMQHWDLPVRYTKEEALAQSLKYAHHCAAENAASEYWDRRDASNY